MFESTPIAVSGSPCGTARATASMAVVDAPRNPSPQVLGNDVLSAWTCKRPFTCRPAEAGHQVIATTQIWSQVTELRQHVDDLGD